MEANLKTNESVKETKETKETESNLSYYIDTTPDIPQVGYGCHFKM